MNLWRKREEEEKEDEEGGNGRRVVNFTIEGKRVVCSGFTYRLD